jgi:hypothetical protein
MERTAVAVWLVRVNLVPRRERGMGTVPEKIAVTRSIPTTSIPKPNLTGMRKEMEGGANQRREERIFWINDCFEDDKGPSSTSDSE